MTTRVEKLLRRLEEDLLKPETRRCATQLDNLLAKEFLEIGSSGRKFNKDQIIQSLLLEQHQPSTELAWNSIEDFTATRLTAEVALLTYRLITRHERSGTEVHTLRCSIWKSTNNRWQMIFHQGTPSKR